MYILFKFYEFSFPIWRWIWSVSIWYFRGGGGRRGGGRGGRGRGHSDRDHGRDSEGGHGKHKRFNEGQDGGNNAKNQKTEWIDMTIPPFLVDGWDTWRLFRDLCPSFTTILLRCLFFGCNANSPKLLIYLRENEKFSYIFQRHLFQRTIATDWLPFVWNANGDLLCMNVDIVICVLFFLHPLVVGYETCD